MYENENKKISIQIDTFLISHYIESFQLPKTTFDYNLYLIGDGLNNKRSVKNWLDMLNFYEDIMSCIK